MPLLIGAGVLLLLLVGVAVYFATRGSDESSSGGAGGGDGTGGTGSSLVSASKIGIRPKRELPRHVFAYVPTARHSVELTTHTGPYAHLRRPLELDEMRELAVPEEQITHVLRCSAAGGLVYVYATKNPTDLAKTARAKKWTEQRVASGTTFYRPVPPERQVLVAIQPGPNVLVFVGRKADKSLNTELIEELFRRTAADNPLPRELWGLLEEVSGYNLIVGGVSMPGDETVKVDGRFCARGKLSTDTHDEHLSLWACETSAEATRFEAEFKKWDAEHIARSKWTPPEMRYEVVGARLYRLSLTPRGVPK
jgi:hypothetical protein